MKRAIAILLCAGMLLGLLCGCDTEETPYTPTGDGMNSVDTPTQPAADGTEPEDKNTEIALAYDPDDSMNPLKATGYTNRALFSLIYQGLFTVSRDYVASPMLCKSYNVSADRKTYTFYLADATYSDGTAVTAADAVASLKAAQDSSWYGGRLQHVTSISSYGEAVVLVLDTPMENLPILLDIPIVKASEVNSDSPLGSGPYMRSGSQLRRQAGWWCNTTLSVSSDTIQLVASASAAEVRDAFEFDNVALVCTDPAGRDYVDFHSDYELWDCENGLFLYLVCNTGSSVFSNATVRAALTHAIDRDSLVSTYYRSFAYSATLPASPQSPYYSNSLANDYEYDPEKFALALEEAEIYGGNLTLLLNSDDPLRLKVGKAIAEMLASYGFTVTIEEATGDDFTTLLKKGNYDLYLAQTRLSANMDLSAFFGTKTALNYGGLSDPATYATCLEALADADNYYTLHEMVMDNGQLCPILFQTCSVYTQRGVFSDFAPARDNVFYYDLGRTLSDALISE